MALADTARLVASLELQDKFSRTADKFDSRLGGMQRNLQTFGRNLQIGAAFGIGALAVGISRGLEVLQELETVTSATNAVIESTGGAAGQTAEDIRNLAEKFEGLNATMDDKVIQSGENVLLTFTNIKEDAFEPALEAALNLNQALGGGEEGLQGTIIQVGKALNDPVRGITALRRVGVSFTRQQEDQIRALVEANDLYGAQRVVLQELEREFGGQFAAAGDTAAGNFAKFRDTVEDTQATLATAFLPVLLDVSDKLTEFLSDPAVQQGIKDFGDDLAGAFESLVELAGNLPWDAIGSAFELMGTGAKAVLTAFTELPPWVQTAVLTAWGTNKLTGGLIGTLVSSLASGLIKGVLGINAGVVNVNAATVNGGAPVGGGTAGGAGGLIAGAVGTAAAGTAVAGGVLALGQITSGTEEGVRRGFIAISGGFSGLIANAVEEAIGDPLGDLIAGDTKTREKMEKGNTLAAARAAEAKAALQADNARLLQSMAAANVRLQQISQKDFSPRVNVSVTSNVSVTDITRRLTSMRISVNGTGGVTADPA